ncbi:Friend virus susceptibility protein 1-like [Ochotona curzoniae]|uniref:Friend virus susceptibility protein 1-like n=1 Tax=Ochotona curzoniae TaxID=130825 RepID=UPI001B3525E6|nr:Friend virus susceptibility protein 1-like [Ochotona curzoniae]
MGFLNWFWGLWTWLFPVTTPKSVKDSTSGSAEGPRSPWQELFSEICKINAFDAPDSPLVRGKDVGDSVHGTFEHLCRSREHSEAGWLLLASLDKVLKEKEELREMVARLQLRLSDLRVSKSVLGESLLACSRRAEVAENQTQALAIRLAELQRKLSARPRRVSAAKVRSLVGKEWDPASWDGDVWEDPGAGDAELLNFDEAGVSLEMGLPPPRIIPTGHGTATAVFPLTGSPTVPLWAFPPLSRELHSTSPEEVVPAFRAAGVRQGSGDAPPDPPAAPVSPARPVARPVARRISQLAPEVEADSVSPELGGRSPQDLLELSDGYKQKSEEPAWEWMLRVWESGGKDVHLTRAEFVDMGALSQDPAFNAAAQDVKKGSDSLFGWLAEAWVKRWPTASELEMPDLPWLTVEEGIQRLREIGMVEWLCHLRSTPLPWEGPEDALLSAAVRKRFVRAAPASLKSCVVALLCGPGLTVGTAIAQLESLSAVGML